MEERLAFGEMMARLWAAQREEDNSPDGLQPAMVEAGSGLVASRAGWDVKGMFICLMPGVEIPAQAVNARSRRYVPEGPLRVRPYLCMVDAQGMWCPGWRASQTDMISNDWRVCLRKDL